jgi:prepilin-type N-terminal cleavage/methylation domain-containing protein
MVRNNKGFTLVELMVVIVIIGILAALAIPKFTAASDKAKWSEVPSVLASYENAQLARLAETNALGSITAGNLVFEVPGTGGVTKWFTYSETINGTTDATYDGLVTGTAEIGGIGQNEGVQTVITAATGGIAHSSVGCGDAPVNRMMGNFLAAGSGSGS